jgi:hypothetical protein
MRRKIIDGLRDAVARDLARVTIGGVIWVRKNEIPETAKTYSDVMRPDGWATPKRLVRIF